MTNFYKPKDYYNIAWTENDKIWNHSFWKQTRSTFYCSYCWVERLLGWIERRNVVDWLNNINRSFLWINLWCRICCWILFDCDDNYEKMSKLCLIINFIQTMLALLLEWKLFFFGNTLFRFNAKGWKSLSDILFINIDF